MSNSTLMHAKTAPVPITPTTKSGRGRRGYLSFSANRWRVVVRAAPVCADKATPAEALAAARQLAVELAPAAWNGDRGEWVWLESIEDLRGKA